MKIGATLNYSPLDHAARWFGRFLPKGLYARALIIIIAPVILLQSVVAYVFMERHYELVTRRLSSAVTVHWVEDGDHDFRPRKPSGRPVDQNWQEAIAAVVSFVEGLRRAED